MKTGMGQLRDQALTKVIRKVFAAHPLIRSLRLQISVNGAVAHIYGKVPGEEYAVLIRKVASMIRGIQGVWDILRVGKGRPKVIDIGCGNNKQADCAYGVDKQAGGKVDIVADISRGLPFKDGRVDYVFCVHCLEHVADLISAMREIHRVLAPLGVAHIMVPQHPCVNSIADPTHVRFFNRQSFKYFCTQRPGIPSFKPLLVSSNGDTVTADLLPVKDGARAASDEELSLFFD
ncbi:MAG: methyltransferase domain-containing protein [Deltaproteobacteria bacterium]